MRLAALFLLLALPLLAACDSGKPTAATTPAKPVAVAAPTAKTPNAAKVPAGASALMGTWAADLGQCGDAKAVTVIAANSYQAAGASCDMTLAGNKDGSFTASCGDAKIGMTPIFAPSGEGIHLMAGDKKSTVYRCKR